MGVVYILKNNLNGKQYVGSTIRPIEQRLKEHQNTNTDFPIHKAIKKYGWENFSYEVVFTSDDASALRQREGFEMDRRNTFGEDGYNLKGVSSTRNPNCKSKIMTFRLSTTAQELIKRYCDAHGTNSTEAVERLVELGTLLDLSNEYNGEGKNE